MAIRSKGSKGSKAFLGFLCVWLLVVVSGCSKADSMPPEIDLSDKDPTPVEIIDDENLPIDTDSEGDIPKTQPKEYGDHPEAYEAYISILKENNIAENKPITVGDRKIAIEDIYGDETPEMLYIYRDDIHDYLAIFTYSSQGGQESIFHSRIYTAAGGGDNFCIYLTSAGEFMLYHSTFNAQVSWGFWQIIPYKSLEIVDDYGVYNYSSRLATLFYVFIEGETIYMQNGVEVSEKEYDKSVKEIMCDIDRVLFQSTESERYGLYVRDDLWKDTTRFEAECMTYDETIAWLETQLENKV